MWRRRFEVFLPFTAKLTVFCPEGGQLHILNSASPVSSRKTRLFVPICKNFDKDSPLQPMIEFNHQVLAEDIAIVERQCRKIFRSTFTPKRTSLRLEAHRLQKEPRELRSGTKLYGVEASGQAVLSGVITGISTFAQG
jgi:phenylpropionate dioxygenase-like ring-hydroxylating dioxygenase large terminal subunit